MFRLSLPVLEKIIFYVFLFSSLKIYGETATQVEVAMKLDPHHLSDVMGVFDVEEESANTRLNYFFETSDKNLAKHALILRARVEKNEAEITIKSRPTDERLLERLPEDVREKVKCEWDRGYQSSELVLGCSLSTIRSVNALMTVVKASSSPFPLLSSEQKIFLNIMLGETSMDSLILYPAGPAYAYTWKGLKVPDVDVPLTLEIWWLPMQVAIVELSTRAKRGDLPGVLADLARLVQRQRLPVTHDAMKTGLVVEHFRYLKALSVVQAPRTSR